MKKFAIATHWKKTAPNFKIIEMGFKTRKEAINRANIIDPDCKKYCVVSV